MLAMAAMAGCASDKDGGYNESGNDNSNGSGKGGSMARFTIVGDYIYTVDEHSLKIASISDPSKPTEIDRYNLTGWSGDIETIFPYDGKLFIGSRSAMYIYDISIPRRPQLLSYTSHFRSCDPIVAYGNRAYITLNNASLNCGGRGNFLLVYDISDINKPTQIKSYQYGSIMYPKGLGVDGAAGKLFVCTSKGVEVWNVTDIPEEPLQYVGDLTDIPGMGIFNAYDVVPLDGLLIVIGPDGLFMFDYTQETITALGSIDLR